MNDHSNENSNHSANSHRSHRDDTALAIELWAKHSSGESLDPSDIQWLQTHWQDSPATRQRIADEQWIDHLLRLQAETPAETEAFVQQVLQRCLPTPGATGLPRQAPARISAARRWGWLIAAALVIGVTAAGIWYNVAPNDRSAHQAESPRALPPDRNVVEALPSSPPRDSQDPANNDLPTLDPSIIANMEQRSNAVDTTAPLDAPQKNQASETVATHPPITDPSGPILATVSRVEPLQESPTKSGTTDANTAWNEGQRLSATVLQVDDQDVQLTMTNGTVIDLYAPSRAELIDENSLRLWHGEISAHVPPRAVGFQVFTPTATIIDLGTTFDVLVNPNGITEIEVRSGQVSVIAHDRNTQQQWRLQADDNHNLTLYSPAKSTNPDALANAAPPQPHDRTALAARLRHISGRMNGIVSYDGRSLNIDDETVFSNVRDRLFHGLQSAEPSLPDTWTEFVTASTAGPPPQGQLRLNDQEFEFANFNDVIKAQNQFLSQFANGHPPGPPANAPNQRPDPARQQENFRGSLMIHGKRRDFNSWEEYRAAMKDLLGPLAEFGAFPFLP